MTPAEESVIKTIAAHDALIKRARWIVDGPPLCLDIEDISDRLFSLMFDNGQAILIYPEIEYGYDDDPPTIVSVQVPIRLDLMAISDEQLTEWKAHHKRIYDDEQRVKEEELQRQKDERDKREYERLKRRFEK
jgi:hypothetical protein